jgi:hypothetical protein
MTCPPGTAFVYDTMRDCLDKMDTPVVAPVTPVDIPAQIPASLPPLSAGDTKEHKVAVSRVVEGEQTGYHPVVVICLRGTRANMQRFNAVHMALWGWHPNSGRASQMHDRPMIGDLRPYLEKGVKFYYMHRTYKHIRVRHNCACITITNACCIML